MTAAQTYHVAIFESVNQSMWAIKILKAGGIPHKLIPVPRHISSDCGVCIRIESSDVDRTMKIISGVEGFLKIEKL